MNKSFKLLVVLKTFERDMQAAITPTYPGTWNSRNISGGSSSANPRRITLRPTLGYGSDSTFIWKSTNSFTVFPASSGALAYFEITAKYWVGIGICRASFPLGGLRPGWGAGSAGFHGDNGQLYLGSGTGKSYGRAWQPDDRIGCGVKLRSGTVFFTVNGENIGAATVASQGAWHFCVGFHSKESGQAVIIHYTPTDWKFDPFVKICVLTCENCSSAEFPACS
ncbi:hypothetical protein BC936DRAFT_137530, partial [Jimgerdemannia flammicorona]